MADTITQILGNVTAYSDAVAAGYTGTREQFAADQANFAANATEVASNLGESKQVLADVNAALNKLVNLDVSAETLAPGSNATVSKTETETGYTLAFGVPRGDKGEQGDRGATGERGLKGDKGDTGEVSQAQMDAAMDAKAQEIIDDVTEVNGGDFVWVE